MVDEGLINKYLNDPPNQLAYLTLFRCSFTYFDQCYSTFWGRMMRLYSSRISEWVFFFNYTHSLPHTSILICLLLSHWNLAFVLVILQWIFQIALPTDTLLSSPEGWPLWTVSPVFSWVCQCRELAQRSGGKTRASSIRTAVWQRLPSFTEGHSSCSPALASSCHSHPLFSLEGRNRNGFPLFLNLRDSSSLIDSLTLPHFSK